MYVYKYMHINTLTYIYIYMYIVTTIGMENRSGFSASDDSVSNEVEHSKIIGFLSIRNLSDVK